jgi:hypothetical protein
VGYIYRFADIADARFFLVGENKSFAGKEHVPDGDATGRPLSIAWFEVHESVGQGDVMQVAPSIVLIANLS